MTIQDAEQFVAGLWDWAILEGCFGDTRIRPTDIEGFVERNGFFLCLETKAPGVTVKRGQERTFLNFSLLERNGIPRGTVCVLWGHTNTPERAQFYINGQKTPEYRCNTDDLRRVVRTWFEAAEANKPFILGRRS